MKIVDNFKAKYEEDYLRNELVISVLILVALIIFHYLFGWEDDIISLLNESRKALYTSVASISGAILGFTIAGVSIIFALIGNSSLDRVKESSNYKDIYKTYISAIRFLAIATFSAIAGILLDKKSNPLIWVFYLNVWSVTIASFRVSRCVWILENLIDIVAGSINEDEEKK